MEPKARTVGRPVPEQDLRWFVRWTCRQALRASREHSVLQGDQPAGGRDAKAQALAEKARLRAVLLAGMIMRAKAFEDVVFPRVGNNPRVLTKDLHHVLLRRRLQELVAAEPPNSELSEAQCDARVRAFELEGEPLTDAQVSFVTTFTRFEDEEEPARLAKRLVEKTVGPASSIQGRVKSLSESWPTGRLDSLSVKILRDVAIFRWAAFDREGDSHHANREAAVHALLEAFELPPRTLVFLLDRLQQAARARLVAVHREAAVSWIANRLSEEGLLQDVPAPEPACIFCGDTQHRGGEELVQRGPVHLHDACAAKVDPECPSCRGRGFICALDADMHGEWAPCLCGTGVRFNRPQGDPPPPPARRHRRRA